MGETRSDRYETGFDGPARQRKVHPLSPAGIARQNGYFLRRYQDFRRAADAVIEAWRHHPEVAAVALIGSAAVPPWKEVPRFSPYRRARIELWHECGDLDLAVWLDHLRDLNRLRRAKDRAVSQLSAEGDGGAATHQVDVFVLQPGTDRYLGRLCLFNSCPKGKTECLVPGCGATRFLQQIDGFRWRPESLAPDRSVRLFDRATGQHHRATDLPLPDEEDSDGEGLA